MSLYERIKSAALTHGLSINKLEKALGFSNGTIGKWKKAAVPYADRLLAVASYLNTTVEYLMTGKDETVSLYNNNVLNNSINESPNSHLTINDNSNNITKQELELLVAYRELSIKEQAKMVSFLINLKSDKSD